MAKLEILAPWILSWEGGFANVPGDRGGATNMGVTIATWRSVGYDKDGDGDIDVRDLRLITRKDVVERVMRPHYWNRWRADYIEDQSIANILVDWVWASGAHGIKKPQAMLGVTVDGIVGQKTLAALNAREPKKLFADLHALRTRFINNLVNANPSQKKFQRGWLRRLNSIKYGRLINA